VSKFLQINQVKNKESRLSVSRNKSDANLILMPVPSGPTQAPVSWWADSSNNDILYLLQFWIIGPSGLPYE
jgi:hypothetical protein